MTHTPFVSNPCPATAIVFVSQNLFYGQLPHRGRFLLRGERSNAALAGIIETASSEAGTVLTGSATGRIIQKGGAAPLPFGR